MKLPKDPVMLLSVVNTELRDRLSVIGRAGKGVWCDGTGNHRPAGT